MPNAENNMQLSAYAKMEDVFLFVVWSRARPYDGKILSRLSSRFEMLDDFEISWPKRHFVENLASFYGWKSWHVWRNKARKCGTGPFRVFVVRDPSPVWSRECDTSGHSLLVDSNVTSIKKEFRRLVGRSNIVHSSVTHDETVHQLAALDSAHVDPIPFRRFCYPDDGRVREGRRATLLSVAGDILVPLAASVFSGVAVWLDFHVLKTSCDESGLVELLGLALAASCGALMTACAIAAKSGRGAHAILAAVFFDLAIREADYLVDPFFGRWAWTWLLSIVTISFAMVTIRFAKTVYSGLKAMHRSRRFPLFACGVALLLFVSQFLGMDEIWQSLGVENPGDLSRLVEECVELFGYALMFSWVLPHSTRVLGKRR